MTYDVINNYDWTSAPKGSSFRKQAPRVWMRSYKLRTNNLYTTLENYINILTDGGGSAESFYDKMYSDVTTSEDEFRFPFFNDTVRSFSNTFGDTFQDGVGGAGGIGTAANDFIKSMAGLGAQVSSIAGGENIKNAFTQFKTRDFAGARKTVTDGILQGGNPGSYVETPMFYQFEKNDGPLEVSFVLSNTINPGEIKHNQELVTKLTTINRPLRTNSIAVDPPRIYKITVPGQRFIRWAYCTQFGVQLLGAKRMIDNAIVPEGFQINMTFQSLTLEHAGFMKRVKEENG